MATFCEKPTLRFVLINVLFHQERQGAPWSWYPSTPLFLVSLQEGPKRFARLAAQGGWEAKRQSATSMGREKEGQEEKRGIPDA